MTIGIVYYRYVCMAASDNCWYRNLMMMMMILFNSIVRIRVRVRNWFSVWLVRGYAHLFILFSVVFVPHTQSLRHCLALKVISSANRNIFYSSSFAATAAINVN